MREAPSGYIEPPPSPHPPKSNLPMLYYGFAVVSTTVIVLALYNLIIIKCCMRRQTQQGQRPNGLVEATTAANQSFENTNRNFLSIFNYKKDMNITGGRGQEQEQGCEYECPVCLSVFEEGEEVRQLPRCKHSFHAPCIDMWLYTHFDCPLCRAPVDVSRYDRHMHMNSSLDSPEHSREILFGGSSTS